MNSDDNPTLRVPDRLSDQGSMRSTLELHVRSQDGTLKVLPLGQPVVEFEPCAHSRVRVTCQRGEVFFRNLTPGEPSYLEGAKTDSARLEVGDFVEISGCRLLLWDNEKATAYLKGYTAPFAGEIWALPPGEHTIGRLGKRQNAINLDHPTVSREHASILSAAEGYHLVAESSTNPVYVSGACVPPGSQTRLSHGDLIELGDLVFRFHCPGGPAGAPSQGGLLSIQSLGSFRVSIQGKAVQDKDWKTQHAKWLFAHLLYEWGRPLAVDRVLGELWPEMNPEKGRNNLNYTLSILRQTLRSVFPELVGQEVVLRSRSSLQVDLSLFQEHDYVLLRRDLEQAAASQPEDVARREHYLARALAGYAGPFLADCYLDWVQSVRMSLELEVLDGARQLFELLTVRQAWEEMIPLSTRALTIDPFSQGSCLALMRSLRERGRVSEALKVFETFRKGLHKELAMEPGIELLTEHQRILLSM